MVVAVALGMQHGSARGVWRALPPIAIGHAGAVAVALHTGAYFTVMMLAAWIVYRKLGLGLLRKAWFNLDWLWAGALVLTGLVVVMN